MENQTRDKKDSSTEVNSKEVDKKDEKGEKRKPFYSVKIGRTIYDVYMVQSPDAKEDLITHLTKFAIQDLIKLQSQED